MSLRVAVQMDPLESINIAGDSTFAIMLGAQARGHQLWHYTADALSWAARAALDDGLIRSRSSASRATISASASRKSSISAATSTSC